MADYVTHVMDDWAKVRPDLDTAPLEVALRLQRVGQLVQERLDSVAGSQPSLSHKGDLDTLTALRRSDGSASPSELAGALRLTSGGMTNRLDRLEAAGLVRRTTAETDRRAIVVSLTSEGARVADEAFAANLREQRELITGLTSEERTDLAALLSKLLVDLGDEW